MQCWCNWNIIETTLSRRPLIPSMDEKFYCLVAYESRKLKRIVVIFWQAMWRIEERNVKVKLVVQRKLSQPLQHQNGHIQLLTALLWKLSFQTMSFSGSLSPRGWPQRDVRQLMLWWSMSFVYFWLLWWTSNSCIGQPGTSIRFRLPNINIIVQPVRRAWKQCHYFIIYLFIRLYQTHTGP